MTQRRGIRNSVGFVLLIYVGFFLVATVGLIYGMQVSGEEHQIPEFAVAMIVSVSILVGIVLCVMKYGKNVEK
jgi:hypothetical protein